jgi:hypothetical protein
MAFYPDPAYGKPAGKFIQTPPKILVFYRFFSAGSPVIPLPGMEP